MARPSRRVTRREFLALGATTLGAAYLAACGGGGENGDAGTPVATTTDPTATPEPGALRWSRVAFDGAAPAPRRDHSLVSDGERLYVFGGRDGGGPLGDLWIYDLQAATWSQIALEGGPGARFGHNGAWDAARGRALIFGGQAGAAFFDDLWEYDPAAGRWFQAKLNSPTSPAARYGAASALDGDGRLLVTHGFTSTGRFDDSWAYDFAAEGWEALAIQGPLPVERCLVRGVWDPRSNHLLMFGGQTTAEPFLGDTWALAGLAWREIIPAESPSPRNFYAMAFDEDRDRAVLAGGASADGLLNDVWLFDATREQWSLAPVTGEAPTPRAGHDAAIAGDRLFVFGGQDAENHSADLWQLTLEPS